MDCCLGSALKRLLLLSTCSFLSVCTVIADSLPETAEPKEVNDSPDTAAEHLTGNWGGIRDDLATQGIEVESILDIDSISDVSGGLSREHNLLGKYSLTLAVDTEKANLWSDGTFFVYFLGAAGEPPSADVGDSQVTDNIESLSATKLYELFYEHRFFDARLSLLAGLHDYNSEYQVLNYALTLMNSSFGVTKELSQVGPSIYSTTAAAARIKLLPTDDSYVMTALYDGLPGNPSHPHGTHIDFKKGDGLFWANEFGVNATEEEGPENYYKAGLGFWYQTTDFEDFSGTPRDLNWGYYAIGESSIWREEDKAQGLGAFLQLGFTQADRNEFSRYYGFGLNYTGLIPSFDEDVTAIGFAQCRNSDEFMSTSPGEFTRAETAYEITYRTMVLPYLSLQPDLQFVVNPSTSKEVKDAVVVGLRAELAM